MPADLPQAEKNLNEEYGSTPMLYTYRTVLYKLFFIHFTGPELHIITLRIPKDYKIWYNGKLGLPN